MSYKTAGLAAQDLDRTVTIWRQSAVVRAVLQILFLISVGAAAALAKKISLPLGIPGHSALLWLAPLVAGRAIVRRDGAGILMGVSLAVWGTPVGLEHTLVNNLGLYGVTGLALDLAARLPRISFRNPLGAGLGGALAHMVKFGFIVSSAFTSGATHQFLVFGLAQSALLHLAFGAAAGFLGWGVYRIWQHGRN